MLDLYLFSVCQCTCRGIARQLCTSYVMAKSKYEYVRDYEQDVRVAMNNFIVLRIDGRGFHKCVFSVTKAFNRSHLLPLVLPNFVITRLSHHSLILLHVALHNAVILWLKCL